MKELACKISPARGLGTLPLSGVLWGRVWVGVMETPLRSTSFQEVGPFLAVREFELGIHIYFCLLMSFFVPQLFLRTIVLSIPAKRSFVM